MSKPARSTLDIHMLVHRIVMAVYNNPDAEMVSEVAAMLLPNCQVNPMAELSENGDLIFEVTEGLLN